MRKFSDGSDATLGQLRKWATLFGDKAVELVDQKIAESPRGGDDEIIADEGQVLILLASLS